MVICPKMRREVAVDELRMLIPVRGLSDHADRSQVFPKLRGILARYMERYYKVAEVEAEMVQSPEPTATSLAAEMEAQARDEVGDSGVTAWFRVISHAAGATRRFIRASTGGESLSVDGRANGVFRRQPSRGLPDDEASPGTLPSGLRGLRGRSGTQPSTTVRRSRRTLRLRGHRCRPERRVTEFCTELLILSNSPTRCRRTACAVGGSGSPGQGVRGGRGHSDPNSESWQSAPGRAAPWGHC